MKGSTARRQDGRGLEGVLYRTDPTERAVRARSTTEAGCVPRLYRDAAGTGAGARQLVVGVEKPACLHGQAAAADAADEFLLQSLDAEPALLEDLLPST
jgi:hypothetical protein